MAAETFTCWHCGETYDVDDHLGWCDERGDACDYCELVGSGACA